MAIKTIDEVVRDISKELSAWDGESVAEIACEILYDKKIRYLGNEEFEVEENPPSYEHGTKE